MQNNDSIDPKILGYELREVWIKRRLIVCKYVAKNVEIQY